MGRRTGNLERTVEHTPKLTSDKYSKEYACIIDKLTLAAGEEIFPLLVKLMRICAKLYLPLPVEYAQYYSNKKSKLSEELRYIEKRIIISQINNENYAHLEERKVYISNTLGINAL